ncbi:hypothetical protein RDWZM_005077 [Blomia tropicalis]|uniref:Cysteine--tRNA ligase, cytoplasmic n=1 Tax=Blomia tropicalis TaxID=40697 RepID=A0A9Q0RM99_BLOTA|nr:hypothetical protein RDWZM_005077 [Blomia tropicalis]
MSSMTKRSQPTWSAPENVDCGRLQIYNSLTRRKNVFQPLSGKRVHWYNCGPTVYDSSHMGHARSYITFDIIRRILRDYFHYDVFFVQNVTDIDDKIIRRARQNHLFEKYQSELIGKDRAVVFQDAGKAFALLTTKLENETDPDKRTMLTKMVEATQSAITNTNIEIGDLVQLLKDPLSMWLDKEFGNSITDNEIFISLPRHFENDYNEDMQALNILPPDCITRVSEYVPEIVKYVQQIIDNGFGYVSNGSVYFDTEKFAQDDKHFYAKLVPEAYGDNKALAEGEGDLSTAIGDEKRNANDFALWKDSKPGEPSWPSPWGHGRPGWHIECSVMASELFGNQMDIHSGGIDLRFPHHDNEMAQAEAFYNSGLPWVNYFLHSGHLTISGCKMSKSLKNFITIKEALSKNTARQLRLAFLLHSWKDTLDYSDNTMTDAVNYEKTVNEFFLTVKDIVRNHKQLSTEKKVVKWNDAEKLLHQKFQEHIVSVDQALKDNIDTKTACDELRRLITAANIYIQEKQTTSNVNLLNSIARFITNILNIFGCIGLGEPIGFPIDQFSGSGFDREQEILPFIEVVSNLRQEIRSKARELKSKELFQLCDSIRDDILPQLGVRMEDYETDSGLQTRLKFVDKDILLRERDERIKAEQLKQHEKETKNKLAAKPKEAPIAPSELFRKELDKYSQFDDNGLPTHDHEGKELSKSAAKKVAKLYQIQEKKYNDYLKQLQNLVGGDAK